MKDIVFIIYVGIALIFLVYSIMSWKNKKMIYTIQSEKISVLKDKYYNLQLWFCVLNCILLILCSVFMRDKANTAFFVSCYLCIFWVVNYSLKFIGIKMKYLNI